MVTKMRTMCYCAKFRSDSMFLGFDLTTVVPPGEAAHSAAKSLKHLRSGPRNGHIHAHALESEIALEELEVRHRALL
jgi:hypothetical protein